MSDIQPRYFTGTLIYVSEHGDVPNSVSLPAGISLPESYLPELTADGYNFLGWYSTSTYDIGTEVAAGYIFPTSELTIYAKWEALKSLKQTLTAIADEIRVLSGTTEPMGLDAMTEHVSEANDSVSTESDLITQITNALEGKSAVSVETCSIHNVEYTAPITIIYIDGNFVLQNKEISLGDSVNDVLKNSLFCYMINQLHMFDPGYPAITSGEFNSLLFASNDMDEGECVLIKSDLTFGLKH